MILSMDSFSDILGISLIDKEEKKIILRESFYKIKPFSELIVSRLDRIFCDFNIEKTSLTKIIINKGPGSLTSLRVGITVAKTLAYSLKIPIYGYISLDAMAYLFRYWDGKIITLINAGQGEMYTREYISKNNKITPVSQIKVEKVKDFSYEENSLVIMKNLDIYCEKCIPLNEDLSSVGWEYAIENNLIEDVMKIEPVYIRGL